LVHIGQAPLIARYFSFRSETSSARLALGILGTPRVSSQDLLRLMTPFGLSPRECEVVALKVRCVSLGAIGKELGLSVASVRSIWLRAALKLGCETTPEILHLIDGLLCAPNALRLPTFFNRQG
jgi:DNA-binding CsgD family transcriptional regulator